MSDFAAILSVLHEGPDRHSGTRLFRGRPVIEWSLRRLSMSQSLGAAAVLCWEDQLDVIGPVAEEIGAFVLAKGPRQQLPQIESVAASRRWSDGWRGGLLGTCAFDIGFYAPWFLELTNRMEAEAAVLVDPSASLVDPILIDQLISHAQSHPDQDLIFTTAAPGLCGTILRRALLEKLETAKTHAGRLLHYAPDHVSRELIGSDNCMAVVPTISRTTSRFVLDSDRQIARTEHATACLNGKLQIAGALEIVQRLTSEHWTDPLPREIVIELSTRRETNPIFLPTRARAIARDDMSLKTAKAIFRQLDHCDDIRISFDGIGDAMLNPDFFDILQAARDAGINALHAQTDLLGISPETIKQLAHSPLDVISFHLPAVTPSMYFDIMGVDGYRRVIDNLGLFVTARQARGIGLPIIVPIFTKCRQNLGEMEAWYDQWLRALNCAVIRGTSTFGGLLEDVGVTDMTPPGRRPCARLSSRLTILSDGRVVTCEEDLIATQTLGHIEHDSLTALWTGRVAGLRSDHREQKWAQHPVCATCNQWHRP